LNESGEEKMRYCKIELSGLVEEKRKKRI